MNDRTLDLQGAVLQRLKTTAALTAIVPATKIFDRVMYDTSGTYIGLSGWQVIEDGTDCADAFEVFFDVQVYSDVPGRTQAARVAAQVAKALHRFVPAIANTNTEVLFRSTNYFTESDGETTRAVVNFQALMDSDS